MNFKIKLPVKGRFRTEIFYYIVLFLAILSCTPQPKEGYIITNVNIIPMNEETILENRNLVVKNGKIVAISQPGDIPENMTVIDGKGKYVIPGLIDMHTYLGTTMELYLFLVNGVTTIRNLAGSETHLEVRKQLEQRVLIGPKMFTSSPIISGAQPLWKHLSYPLISTYKVELALKQFKTAGYDSISTNIDIPQKVYFKIVEIAKELDFPIAGQIPLALPVLDAVSLGRRSFLFSQTFMSDQKAIKTAVEQNIFLCPSLVMELHFDRKADISAMKGLEYVPDVTREIWDRMPIPYNNNMNMTEDDLKTFHEMGGKLVTGSGAFSYYLVSGFSLHEELQLLVEKGISPYEALKAATINSAECLEIDDILGTIEPEKRADFLVLEKNPLENIENSSSIYGVMQGEKWHSRKWLNAYLQIVTDFVERNNAGEVPLTAVSIETLP